MKKAWFVVIVLLLLLAACRGRDQAGELTATAPAEVPLLALDTLAGKPENYEGQRVQVEGHFAVLPRPACSALVHFSPATWALSDDGVVIRVAGLERIVGPLALDDVRMRVEGRWQRWVGLYGCGDFAVESTIWYLQAERVVEPNPLTRATLTPPGGVALARSATPTAVPPAELLSPLGTPELTTAAPTPSWTATTTLSPTPSQTAPPSPLETPTPTDPVSPTPSPTSLGSPLATPTLLRSASPSETPWPTFTPLPGSSATATPSPTPSTRQLGLADYDIVINEALAAGESHRWYLEGFNSSVVTITVAAAPKMDLELVLLNPQGAELARANAGPAGATETIGGVNLTADGQYPIVVREVAGRAGDYALAVMDIYSIPIYFPGNIAYGETKQDTLPNESFHYWHFKGTTGDSITITLSPTGNTDLVLAVFGPQDMDVPIREIDQMEDGGAETGSLVLAETGFYSILIEEWTGSQAGYQLALTQE